MDLGVAPIEWNLYFPTPPGPLRQKAGHKSTPNHDIPQKIKYMKQRAPKVQSVTKEKLTVRGSLDHQQDKDSLPRVTKQPQHWCQLTNSRGNVELVSEDSTN